MITGEILDAVFDSIFFYPKSNEREEVKEIIENGLSHNETYHAIAGSIVEHLEIERRYNRGQIRDVLQKKT